MVPEAARIRAERRGAVACLLPLLMAVACDKQDARPGARLWTLDDYIALYEGAGEADPAARLPEMVSVDMVLTDSGGDRYQLTLGPTFINSEYGGAYATTEVWQGYDEVWAQPMYVLVTGWSATGAPTLFPPGDDRARPIFSVGPESAFYGPYWATFFVKVPEDVASDRYLSARDIVNDKTLVLTPGAGRVASLIRRPGVIEAPVPDRDRYPSLPTADRIGPVKLGGTGYLDGEVIEFIDFGTGGFRWDSHLVVEEVPLFVLSWRDSAGRVRPLDVPTIGGTGPLFSGRAPTFSNNRPRYGSYWRLYKAVVPAAARVFAPPQFPKVQDALRAAGVVVADVGAEVQALAGMALAAAEIETYVGQVALNPADCFATVLSLGNCIWLNSQEALENHLGEWALLKTDITVTCPFVSYRNEAVPNP